MYFAPIVIMAGTLTAGAAINNIRKRPTGADHRGWFFNAQLGRVERPKPNRLAACLRPLVRRQINKVLSE